jgi:hypothetical protein
MTAATKTGGHAAPFDLAQRSGMNYLLQCSKAIGVAVLLALLRRFLPKLRAAGDSGLFS